MHALIKKDDYLKGIKLSLLPCIINTGHLILVIFSSLLKRYFTKLPKNFPNILIATSLIDVKGDIKISNPKGLFLARKVAGPEPIDLPKTKILLHYTPFLIKKS